MVTGFKAILRFIRGFTARKRVKRLRVERSIRTLQSWGRMAPLRRIFKSIRKAARVIGSWMKTKILRKKYLVKVAQYREDAKLSNQLAALKQRLEEEVKAREAMEAEAAIRAAEEREAIERERVAAIELAKQQAQLDQSRWREELEQQREEARQRMEEESEQAKEAMRVEQERLKEEQQKLQQEQMRMLKDLQAAEEASRLAAVEREAAQNAAREEAEKRALEAEEKVKEAQDALSAAFAAHQVRIMCGSCATSHCS